ncbi:glycosyltransferase family 4 protein [Ramlibacter sp.]|uniref:glycosyltransferase family 4 protein n=1 Tax=Ramlibacter sp. TaxID=1917967 RepID=UPI0035B0FC24
MRIHYVDPALIGRPGHHFDWARRLLAALAAAGHAVQAFIHHDATPDVRAALAPHAGVVPLFRISPYTDAAQLDPVSGPLAHYTASLLGLPARLAALPPADLWLWPTLTAEQLVAIGLARVRTPVAGCIHFPPEMLSPLAPMAWRHGAQLVAAAGLPVRLGVTVRELAPLFEPLLGASLPELPVMVEPAALAPVQSPPRTLGFFGDHNPRKGLHLLDTLVTRLLADGWQVVLQDASGRVSPRQPMPGRLQVLGYVDDLPAAMAGCDLVVAPYDPLAYRAMGSGVVWDAVSRGIPVVAPAGTAPGRWLAAHGAGVTFAAQEPAAILQAIATAREQHEGLRLGARSVAEAWAGQHGTQPFLAALMGPPVGPAGPTR